MTGQSIRPTQFVLSYGVGSIVEAPGGPRVILDFDKWGRVFVSGKTPSVDEFEITDSSASQLLNKGRIFKIPTNLELNVSEAYPVFATGRFPKWSLCEKHDYLFQMSKTDGTNCPGCLQESGTGSARRQAIRFVRACPAGHLDDVDWHGMIHDSSVTCNCTVYEWRSQGSSLSNVIIYCPECNGQVKLSDVYNRTKLCTGRFQERPSSPASACTATAQVTLRGSTSLRIPDIITTITIPRRSTKLHRIFERIELRSIILSQPKWTKQELIDRLKYISEQDPNLVDPPVLDAVNESEESYIMQVIEDMRQAAKKQATTLEEIKLEEFRELKSAATHGYPADPTEQNPQFQINKDDVRNDVKWNSLNLRVAPIENLRVVMVQRGYHRLGSGAGLRRIDTFYDDGHNKWYPGVEQYGEGLFIDAGKSELKVADADWMKICRSRSEVLCHPVFVWWHTLSHRIISALSLDSGYSSASIRERVYIDVDPVTGKASGGIVLYATQPGGDGSMGGLIALVPQFERILESAARNLNSCSNDPLCSEAKISAGSSNGAACYACLLLSETSCEHRNMYLDRNLLRGQP